MKKSVLVSLKWPASLPGIGRFLTFEGETIGTCEAGFKSLVHGIMRGSKMVSIAPQELWVNEQCVVSRCYIEPRPEQMEMAI